MQKNSFKRSRLLLFFLMTVIAVSVVTPPLYTRAKPKISAETVTLKKGKTIKLKVTGTNAKIKWSAKNKKIVSVNQKGVVTAKKSGKTTIIAKVGQKKYTCKVIVTDISENNRHKVKSKMVFQ